MNLQQFLIIVTFFYSVHILLCSFLHDYCVVKAHSYAPETIQRYFSHKHSEATFHNVYKQMQIDTVTLCIG